MVLGVKVILEVSDIFPKNDVDKIMKKFEWIGLGEKQKSEKSFKPALIPCAEN